jgi:hypothetical protein
MAMTYLSGDIFAAVSRTHGPQLHVLVDGVVLQVGVVAEVAAHAALPGGALLQQGVLHIKSRKCGSPRQNTHTAQRSTHDHIR